ncbi:hypothetical protein ACFWPK_04455, partial [Nocardia sp. NPDC058519]|uniref:hypothetical protein n=1 Tax=Nocardia sp. NPDC058519 TaxID=3346535 RepID=UPI0036515166
EDEAMDTQRGLEFTLAEEQQRVRVLRDRVAELEAWKANAETTLAEDKRYIDEANSGELVRRLAVERDDARARATELETERDLWKERAEKGQLHRDDLIKELNQRRARVTELEDENADAYTALGMANKRAEAAQREPIGYAAEQPETVEAPEPLGYLPPVAHNGRLLSPSNHQAVADKPFPGWVVAWAYGPPEAPGKLIGHAVMVNGGNGWFADTVNLDGSFVEAEARYHDWLTDPGYQAMVVELRTEVTE